MVIFDNSESEKLAQADRLVRKKSTVIGASGTILEEPFFDFRTLPETQIMNKQPTADTNFTAPDYEDYVIEEGAVGTRLGVDAFGNLDPVRLHSYLPSGLEGPESCQTFFVIKPFEPSPTSHDIFELENKRLYPLVGPEFSPRRQHAAEPDTTKRGFEIALYPARSSGGVGSPLVADDAYGPIPISADPGAARGADDGGYWYTDYDNGIIRLSRPMLHGPDGVFNPNNVYSDIDGNEVAEGDSNATPQLFAVYYWYTGDFGIDNLTFITVGDGYVSQGLFNGVSASTLQSAVDSLPDIGGTVFIKQGTYDYIRPVVVRGGVRIIGLSGVKITRPRTEPAFVINSETRGVVDGYQTIEGVEIYPRDGVNSGGAIELQSSAADQEIRRVSIRNNLIFGESDAPAITFGPQHNCTYFGLRIEGNIFKRSGTNPVYISRRDRGGNVIATSMQLINNDFQLGDSSASTAIMFDGTVVTSIDGIVIDNNNMESSDINLSIGVGSVDGLTLTNTRINDLTLGDDASGVVFTNNIIEGTVSLQDISSSSVSNNHTGAFSFVALTDSQFTNNITSGTVSGTSTDGCSISNNNITGSLTAGGSLTDTKCTFNTVSVSITAVGNTSVVVSDNIVGTDIDLAASDTLRLLRNDVGGDITLTTVASSVIEGNIVVDDIATTTVTSSSIGNNTCADLSTTTVLDSNLNNNNISNTFVIAGTITDANINNSLSGAAFSSTGKITNANITNNNFASVTLASSVSSNTALESAFFNYNILGTGNLSIGSSNTGDITSSYITGNNISGTMAMRNATSSSIVANMSGNVTVGNMQSVILSNNSGGLFTIGSIDDSIVDKNIGTGVFTSTSTIDTSKLTDNTFASADLQGNVTYSTVNGNTLSSGGLAITGEFSNSVFIGNNMSGNFSVTTEFKYSIYSANRVVSATFVELTDAIISGNEISGTLSSTSGTTGVIFSDNRLSSGSVTHNIGAVSGSIINNSLVSNNFTVSSLASSIFTGNDVTGTFTGVGALTSSTFDSNKVGTVSITGMTNSFFTNNALTSGPLSVGAVSGSFISGNGISGGGNFIATTFRTSVFGGNGFGGDVQFTELGDRTSADNGSVIDNSIITNFTVTETTTDSVISNCTISGDVTLNSGDTDTHTLWRSVIDGNVIGGTIDSGDRPFTDSNITNNNIDGSLTPSALDGSIVSDNIIGGFINIVLNNSNTVNDIAVENSVIDGNVCASNGSNSDINITNNKTGGTAAAKKSVISSNHITGSLDIGATDMISADSICVTGNWVDGSLRIDNNSSSSETVKYSNVSGNATDSISIDNTNTIGDVVVDSNISNNTAIHAGGGGITIGASKTLTNSGSVLFGASLDNNVVESITLANSSRAKGTQTYAYSSVSNNRTKNLLVYGLFAGGIMSGNSVGTGIITLHSISLSVMSDNVFASDVGMSSDVSSTKIIDRSLVHNNDFLGTSSNSLSVQSTATSNGVAIYESVLSGNRFSISALFTTSADTTSPAVQNSLITDNVFGSLLTISSTNASESEALLESSFSNNIVKTDLTLTGGITDSSVDGNIIGDQFDITTTDPTTAVSRSIICDNVVDGISTISRVDTGTSGVLIDESVVSGNRFHADVTWSQTGTNGGTVVDNSTIQGNYFDYSVSILGKTNSTVVRVFQLSAFDGNYVGGHFSIDDTSNANNSEIFTGSVMSGNIIGELSASSSLKIGDSCDKSSTQRAVFASAISGNHIYNLSIMNSGTVNTSTSEGFESSVFSGNYTGGISATFYCGITNSSISSNIFPQFYCGNVEDSVISANRASRMSFIHYSGASNEVYAKTSIISGNAIVGGIAGIYFASSSTGSDVSIENMVIDGNLTEGTFDLSAGSDVTVSNCVISNNYANTFSAFSLGTSPDGTIMVGNYAGTNNTGHSITGRIVGDELAVHVYNDDVGTANTSYDNIVIEDDADSGISILSGTSSTGGLMFGDSGDTDIGGVKYDHSNNKLILNAYAADIISIDSDGLVMEGTNSITVNGSRSFITQPYNFVSNNTISLYYDSGYSGGIVIGTSTTAIIPLLTPRGGTITDIVFRCIGSGGSANGTFSLHEIQSGSIPTNVATPTATTSVSVPVTNGTVSISSISRTVLSTYSYYAKVENTDTTNSLVLGPITLTVSDPRLDLLSK